MIDETPGGIEDIGNRGVRYHIVAGTFVAPLCKNAEGSLGVVNLLARAGDSDEAWILFFQERPQDVRCVAFRVDRYIEWCTLLASGPSLSRTRVSFPRARGQTTRQC